jgi:hypothetical protein
MDADVRSRNCTAPLGVFPLVPMPSSGRYPVYGRLFRSEGIVGSIEAAHLAQTQFGSKYGEARNQTIILPLPFIETNTGLGALEGSAIWGLLEKNWQICMRSSADMVNARFATRGVE